VNQFIFFLVSGAALGALYGLLALGFVIIFKATEVLNFAQGALVVFGALVVARLAVWNFWAALAIGLVATVMLALGIERFLVRSLVGRSVLSATILTIGVDIVMVTVARTEVGTDIIPLRDPWGNTLVTSLNFPLSRIIALFVAVGIAGAFFAWLKWSSWGIAFRAATERREVAALMGINLSRLGSVSWALAGALAVVAGVFLTTFPSPGVSLDLGSTVLVAFAAAVIGGIDSPHGAVVSGLFVGILQVLSQAYLEGGVLGGGFHEVLPWLLMILVLLVRPAGLFGHVGVTRA